LGCGIYEIVAWKAPFSKMTEEQIGKEHANGETFYNFKAKRHPF